MPWPGRRFLSAFADDLISLEIEPDDRRRERTRAWVVERLAGAGQVTRLGIGLTGVLLGACVRAATGRGYDRLPPGRRRRVAGWLCRSSLPLVADYVRAVRALAVSHAYEERFSS